MKVLINCLSSVSGGALSYLRNVVPLLCEQFDRSSGAHQLYILAHETQRELLATTTKTEHVWIEGGMPTSWRRLLWERRNLSRICRRAQIDVVFTPYQIGLNVSDMRQVLMLRNMEPFYFKNYPYSKKSWLRNRILCGQSSRALRGADRVIPVSGFAEDYLQADIGVPSSRVRKIYHGRDLKFTPNGDPNDDSIRLQGIGVQGDFLLTCGSLLPYRRCEDILDAFDRVVDAQDSELKLVIAGSGSDKRYTEKLRKRIAASPHGDRIYSVGHVSKELMIALYRQCKLCLIATEIEACPNIAIEAMSSGCAIISADNPPLPEMFSGSSLGYTPRDIDALSENIIVLLNNEQLRLDYCKRAEERAAAFSWERCAQETFDALVDWPEG